MNQMKYIIVDNGLCEEVVIFAKTFQHVDIAGRIGGRVVSAGFVTLLDGKMECYGKSISLDIPSREKIDTKVVNRMLGVTLDD